MAEEQRPLQNPNAVRELVNNVDGGLRNDQGDAQDHDVPGEAHGNVQEYARGGVQQNEQAEPDARPEVSVFRMFFMCSFLLRALSNLSYGSSGSV